MSSLSGPGSLGNVIAAVCSALIPGFGQLVQGRVFTALIHFLSAAIAILLFFQFFWFVNLWSMIDAAIYRGSRR